MENAITQLVLLLKEKWFQVCENDGLPKYSCKQCAIDVKSALITKRRIIKAHNYLIENFGKRNFPSTSNQNAIVEGQLNNITIPKPTIKYSADVLINGNTSIPQNSENISEDIMPKDEIKLEVLEESQNITPKVEVKLEVLEESQNSCDAVIAEEDSGGFARKSKRKTKPKQIKYTCKECNISFTKKTPYSRHCEMHKKTKCNVCKKMIRSDNFKKHLLVHSSSSPSVCSLCGLTCKNDMSLRGHLYYQHRNLNAYVCGECGAKYNSRYVLLLHQKKAHTGARIENRDKVNTHTTREQIIHTCKECGISFTKKSTYTLHLAKHRKTQCNVCNKMIRSGNFRQHLLVHSSSGPSVCNLCGATCKNLESLRSHIYRQHRNNSHVCEECGKKFKARSVLLVHQARIHTGVRNFKCDTCGKRFVTKHFLMKHDRMTHKKLRPYVCEFCGTGFSSPSALKIHKRRHTNERPYVCDQCDERFRQKVSLRNHLKSKHGIEEAKESICSECGKGFATNFALGVHQRLHASMKCEVCSESFAGQEYLVNHMKEAHGVDVEVNEDESQDIKENYEGS